LVGYHDFYYTPDGDTPEDWDVIGKTKFDIAASTICTEFTKTPPDVASVQVDDIGGFSLHFSGGFRLDVFPDDSNETSEHWRIFQPGVERKHFVFRKLAS
jgi:hypothetical protein